MRKHVIKAIIVKRFFPYFHLGLVRTTDYWLPWKTYDKWFFTRILCELQSINFIGTVLFCSLTCYTSHMNGYTRDLYSHSLCKPSLVSVLKIHKSLLFFWNKSNYFTIAKCWIANCLQYSICITLRFPLKPKLSEKRRQWYIQCHW